MQHNGFVDLKNVLLITRSLQKVIYKMWFDINKDILFVNLEQTSLKGQRMVYDHRMSMLLQ